MRGFHAKALPPAAGGVGVGTFAVLAPKTLPVAAAKPPNVVGPPDGAPKTDEGAGAVGTPKADVAPPPGAAAKMDEGAGAAGGAGEGDEEKGA